MLGLDSAGKTTILYKLQIGEILSTVPTIGAPSRSSCLAQIRNGGSIHRASGPNVLSCTCSRGCSCVGGDWRCFVHMWA